MCKLETVFRESLERIKSRPIIHKIYKNLKWSLFEKGVRLFITFVSTMMVIRYLGPDLFGKWSLSLALVALFAPLAQLGTDTILLRDFSQKKEEEVCQIASSALFMRVIGSLLGILGVFYYAEYFVHSDSLKRIILLISSSTLPMLAFGGFDQIYIARLELKKILLPRLGILLFFSILRICFVCMKCNVLYFVISSVLETFLNLLTVLVSYSKDYGMAVLKLPSFILMRNLARESSPLFIVAILSVMMSRVDQVMLGSLIGSRDLGQYSASTRLVEIIDIVGSLIMQSVAPALLKKHAEGKDIFLKKLSETYALMIVVASAVMLPCILFGKFVISLMLGSGYATAGMLFSILCVRVVISSLGLVRSVYITSEGLFNYVLITLIFGVLFNVGLNYLLIPKYSAMGAVFASIIAFILSNFACDFFYKRMHGNLSAMADAWKVLADCRFLLLPNYSSRR
jgi:O-antigen/teichoic acid export membrane protein